MKITIKYEYKVTSGIGTYCAEAMTEWGLLTGGSFASFENAKKQILEQIEMLRITPTKESEEVEI